MILAFTIWMGIILSALVAVVATGAWMASCQKPENQTKRKVSVYPRPLIARKKAA